MPNPSNHRCDHEENRKKICAPCGRKINLGTKKLDHFCINNKHELLIKKFININFDLSNPQFPLSICTNCRKILQEHDRGIIERPFKGMPNYEDICLPKNTRRHKDTEFICNCFICLNGRHKGQLNMKKNLAVGEALDLSIKITSNNGMYGSKHSNATEMPKNRNQDTQNKSPMKICRICLQEVGRGKKHLCIRNSTSKSRARDNVQKLMSAVLPEKQQEQLCTSLLSNKIEKITSARTTGAVYPSSVSLSCTRGRNKRVILKEGNKPTFFPAESLNRYQVESGASGKQMKNLSHLIRINAGRKSVPAHYAKEVSKRARLLEDLYTYDIFKFDVEKDLVKQKRPVVWGNAEDILNDVLGRRNFVGDYVVKVMADGGQGFFKICMSVIPKNYVTEYLGNSDQEGPSAKRRKVDKWTSVHKLIMLAIVPQIKETYDNLKLLFDLIKINDISMKFVSDFKLILLVNGQQTATSTYPCPYCFITLKDLRERKELKSGSAESTKNYKEETIVDECLKSKMYGDLRNDYVQFKSLGGKKKFAAQSRSTVNAPLFNDNDAVKVITKCLIPELHLLQGFVNHIFWNGLVPLLGREKALLWPQSLNLVSKNYHGDAFEENACRKLLQESDKLLYRKICQEIGGPLPLLPFVAAFKAMDKIVHSCFGVKRVHSDLKQHLKDLKKALLAINVSETLKIHVILSHIEESLVFFNEEEGFGLWSEQAGESIHHEFIKFWDRRKINSMHNLDYPVQLKAAVVDFSSKHI